MSEPESFETLRPEHVAVLAEEVGDAMAAIDGQGRLVWLNAATATAIGAQATPDVFRGRPAADLVHPEDLDRMLVNVSGLAGGAKPRPGSLRLRHRDGSYVSYEVSPSWVVLEGPPSGPGPLVVVTIKDNGLTDAHFNFMSDVSAGKSFRDCVAGFAAGLTSGVDGPMAISFDDEDGLRVWVGDLPGLLAGVTDEARLDRTSGTPWAEAIASGTAVSVRTPDLPEIHREAAMRLGAAAGLAVPVDDPGSAEPVVMVQWPSNPAMVDLLREALARKPHDALAVAVQRRATQRRLEHMATHDDLTDLYNRAPFFARIEELETAGGDYAIWYLDLDHLKAVNDEFGHQAGDIVIVKFAHRLRALAAPGDVVARLGGDEFAIVGSRADGDEVMRFAARLVGELAGPVPVGPGSATAHMSTSVGTARRCEVDDEGPDAVVAAADAALYEAKRSGRRAWRRHVRSV